MHQLVSVFFSWYIARIIKRDFKTFSFNRLTVDNSRAILLLANHFSWWDGFFLYQINRIYFKKKFHVMVSEENYRKVWFLKYLGAFPVKRGSKGMIEALEHGGKLLDDPANLVLVFPQGKLYSAHVTDLQFEKGLIKLINSSARKFQYVFAATFVDYFENRRASVCCYLRSWEGAEFTSMQLIRSAYNKHYELSRQEQLRTII